MSHPQHFTALVIMHIGMQDRPIPELVIYDSRAQKQVEATYPCTREAVCTSVEHTAFATMAGRLEARFFSKNIQDADVQDMGAFKFSLRSNRGAATEIRCNKTHSAEVLRDVEQYVHEKQARAEVDRRLGISEFKSK
jgi:hypothetical protein